jgi:hypothetical protein
MCHWTKSSLAHWCLKLGKSKPMRLRIRNTAARPGLERLFHSVDLKAKKQSRRTAFLLHNANPKEGLERAKRIELSTSTLARSRSTAELRPLASVGEVSASPRGRPYRRKLESFASAYLRNPVKNFQTQFFKSWFVPLSQDGQRYRSRYKALAICDVPHRLCCCNQTSDSSSSNS